MYAIENVAQALSDSASFPNLSYTPIGTTGNIFINNQPTSESIARCLTLYETPVGQFDITFDKPSAYKDEGIKIIYRGTKNDMINCYHDAKEIYDWLSDKINWGAFGSTERPVFKVTPKGMASMGNDDNQYPEYVMKFVIKIIVT